MRYSLYRISTIAIPAIVMLLAGLLVEYNIKDRRKHLLRRIICYVLIFIVTGFILFDLPIENYLGGFFSMEDATHYQYGEHITHATIKGDNSVYVLLTRYNTESSKIEVRDEIYSEKNGKWMLTPPLTRQAALHCCGRNCGRMA